ncbi:MAG: molybdopterin molybdotransferase MoeA [Flavobacteriales bacterium]|nr:molybdopterin molybdotransferase MoeA [Flavobacteriales bacterium]MCB9166877.1 molybdopterin molybdotransferase MoeA [Flavobacteriales bacterium]
MISVEEARQRIMACAPRMPLRTVRIGDADGRIPPEDIVSPHDHPLFDMSAVDGYALAFDGPPERCVVGAIPAGDAMTHALGPGECARIFTGAPIPAGTDTVIMQEHVLRDGERVVLQDPRLKCGANVRRQGEQLHTGEVMHDAGVPLDPPAIGLLASVGITELEVAERPDVLVLCTGNEFAEEGELPRPGRIFNSNGPMLQASLSPYVQTLEVACVTDHRDTLLDTLKAARADLVVSTGGVSVGEHDIVRSVLEELGAEIIVHRVAQKPGKPMLFAMLDGRPVFGLPGNPRAVMVLCWEYVLPFVRAMQQAGDPWPRSELLPLNDGLRVKGGRAEFRAAHIDNGRVTLPADEGSHMLRSLVNARALVYLPADKREWSIGEPIEVHYLPAQ